jgi:chemotaxis protein MotB
MARNLNIGVLCAGLVMGIAFSGCVSSRTHEETLAELEKARHAAAQQAAEDEANLAEARRENERLAARLQEIGQDKLSTELLRDRLTITMVDRVLFESGSDRISPEGMEVLFKVSAVLRDARDKRIVVSGHTDNIQIGPSLRSRFKTNWELSTARATSVVRYLVDHANIAPHSLTAVGHAYTKPVADNDSEQGRSQNRRIEIILYPKDLEKVVAEVEQ